MKFLELAALAKAHPDRIEVMMCGMKKDGAGGETHAEPEDAEFWTSYVRVETPDDDVQPFDIVMDHDHRTKAQAEARAIDLARVLLGDKEKWETY